MKETIDLFGDDETVFMENSTYQRACSFSIAQIGEAVKRLSQELIKRYPEIQWSFIAGMRDVISHGYHSINLGKVWLSVSEEIGPLRETCERILKDIS
jgi:uncharacterized protein with HEPN domain